MALKTSVEIDLKDRFSGRADKITAATGKLGRRIDAADAELKRFGKQRAALDSLARLERGASESGRALDAARKRTAALRAELRSTASPSKKLSDAFERARLKSSKLGEAHGRNRSKLQKLRGEMGAAGIATTRLADAQADLDRKMKRAAESADRFRAKAAALTAQRERDAKSLERISHMSLAGQSAGAVGRSALHALAAPVRMARGVADAQGALQSLNMSPEEAGAVTDRGRGVSLKIPGITPESFGFAAYDIQSGIENLTAAGVADLTEASAVMARGTRAEVDGMTDLMATMHGVFKSALHSEMSDREFGWVVAGHIASAVEHFKTTGPQMKQAIESAGDQMSLYGVSMAEQLAASGVLQKKMPESQVGTGLAALVQRVAKAEDAFAERAERGEGRAVRLTGDDGNVLPLTELMDNLRREFGEGVTTRGMTSVTEAFGSEEAGKVLAALWKAGDEHKAAVAALDVAADPLKGEQIARDMQARRDDNADSRLDLLSQRWDILLLTAGERLLEALDDWIPAMERVIDWIQGFADDEPDIFGKLVLAGGVVSGLTFAAGTAAMALPGLAWSARLAAKALRLLRPAPGLPAPGQPGQHGWFGPKAKTPAPAGGRRGLFGRLIDAGRRIAPRVPGAAKIGKLAPLASKLAPIAKGAGRFATGGATALAAVDLANAAMTSPPGQRAGAIADATGGLVGSFGGAMAGAKLGTLIGTAVFPGAGSAIGAALGGVAGGIAGGELGAALTSWVRGEGAPEPGSAAAADPASFVGPLPEAAASPAKTVSIGDVRIEIRQLPAEDADALAKRVREELLRLEDVEGQGAAFDAA